jgi:hypothetical protein
MSERVPSLLITSAVAAAALLATPASAQELPRCDDLALPNAIYGAGGSAITPALRQVAPYLASLPEPVSVVFSDPSACNGYAAFLNDAATTTFRYWGADGVERQCLPREGGQPVQFAHMGNPADVCAGQTLPAGVRDLQAPVQTLNFIVDARSTQTAVSANALYFIFGFGAAGGVEPWTRTEHLVRRSTSSFVHLFAAAAAGLPPGSFAPGAVEATSNGDSVTRLVQLAEASPETPLAYVAGSTADGARAQVRTLAYQERAASCAFLPDSSSESFDKANVRNGNYTLWTPGHFFYRIDPETQLPLEPNVAEVLGWITGDVPRADSAEITARVIRAGDIPQCAMRVRRDGLVGAIQPFAPAAACGCFFEQTATGQAPAGCTACTSAADCNASSVCSFGFCEASAPAPGEPATAEPVTAEPALVEPTPAVCGASFDDAARLPLFTGASEPLPPLPGTPAL